MNRSQLLRRVIASRVGAEQLLLDQYSGSIAAYSLRLLKGNYSGHCIQVRRSTDDALQNIGFSGGELDTASLLSFLGGASGFVRTWYDQSGSGKDAVQATNAAQPRIVNAGTIDTLEGKNALFFQYIDTLQGYQNIDFSALSITSASGYMVAKANTNTAGWWTNGVNNTHHPFTDGNFYENFFSTTRPGLTGGFANQLYSLYSAYQNGTQLFAYRNNVATSVATATFSKPINFRIGHQGNNAHTFIGHMQEVILFGSDQSSNRTGIEGNINSHYEVYV